VLGARWTDRRCEFGPVVVPFGTEITEEVSPRWFRGPDHIHTVRSLHSMVKFLLTAL